MHGAAGPSVFGSFVTHETEQMRTNNGVVTALNREEFPVRPIEKRKLEISLDSN
jgi:hypothetical protein